VRPDAVPRRHGGVRWIGGGRRVRCPPWRARRRAAHPDAAAHPTPVRPRDASAARRARARAHRSGARARSSGARVHQWGARVRRSGAPAHRSGARVRAAATGRVDPPARSAVAAPGRAAVDLRKDSEGEQVACGTHRVRLASAAGCPLPLLPCTRVRPNGRVADRPGCHQCRTATAPDVVIPARGRADQVGYPIVRSTPGRS
jgi:hypothetical protein